MSRLFRFSLIALLLIVGRVALADVVSLESNYVAGQANIVEKLNNDRVALTNGVNNIRGVFAGSVQSSGQVKADTIGEENMADDANPRIRTAEGASCVDLVSSGFLPDTSASLVLTIPAGVAYPDGYRVEKTSSTAATLTASKWTYYYILSSGSFDTNVTAIDAAVPTAPSNSAVLFRASTDATTISTITDLRTTSCTAGPFENISDATGEGTLEDLFSNGSPVRRFSPAGRTPNGWAQGAFVSWDTHTTFKVTPGSLYINGKYRAVSTNTTVTTGNDAPSTGGSGLDSGAIAASTRYYVYGVADQDAVDSYSISYSTSASAPAGVTNSRLIGSILTDASSLFVSKDVITAHGISDKEVVSGWINFNGSGTVAINNSYNVSSLTDLGVGNYTITWDYDFQNANYVTAGNCIETNIPDSCIVSIQFGTTPTAGAITLLIANDSGSPIDQSIIQFLGIGDKSK